MESSDAGWAQRVCNWDYELTINSLSQYGDPALGIARSYVSSNIRKAYMPRTTRVMNPRVDELFASAAKIDTAKRNAMYAEVQRILLDEVPVAWIAEMKFPTVVNKRAHDVVTSADGTVDSFQDAWVSG